MSELLIKGGDIVDSSGRQRSDVRIADGEIVEVGESLDKGSSQVIDASGCVVSPGLVDLHTHLRQPGTGGETIESGSRAAALGGYTAVVAMPNTEPATDSPEMVTYVRQLAQSALCHVEVAGAITVGRKGEQLAPIRTMAQMGVRFFTDDGSGVQDGRLMMRALQYGSAFDVTLAQHCEDDALVADGVINEGVWSSRLGLPGRPAEAEEIMVMRDIALARLTAARLHFLHLSTAGSVAMVAAAKEQGLAITAEATPHHFSLTDEACSTYDTVYRVNPPLRTSDDMMAVQYGLREGIIDAIATDHAPHPPEAKERPLAEAPPGMLGLETSLALAITELDLPIESILALMSWQPAAIARLQGQHGRPVAVGATANICVIDPETTWVVDPLQLASLSQNTPYAHRKLTGRVRHTILNGEPVVVDGEAQR